GHNNQYAMLPWSAANWNHGRRVVNYDVTPQAIQPLFFQQNAWPNITDQQFITRTQQVFPNAVLRRESLRPVGGVVPPGGTVIEKERVRPNGSVKIKEKVK